MKAATTSKMSCARKRAGAKPYRRPNTALERIQAMTKAGSWVKWFATLPPKEREYERRRLRADIAKNHPIPEAADSDLFRLLAAAAIEFTRTFYPKAPYCSIIVSDPFGPGSKNGSVVIGLDTKDGAE